MEPITITALAGLAGLAAGYVVRQQLLARSDKDLQAKRKEIILAAKEEALKLKEDIEKEEAKRRQELSQTESRLREREAGVERRAEKLEQENQSVLDKQQKLVEAQKNLENLSKQLEEQLAKIAKLSRDEARSQLITQVEKDYSDDIMRKIRGMKEQMRQQVELESREIIGTVIERLATEITAEMTVFAVHLPSDEIKGKIIGKEGRNIQAFERATGVDLIIDETPETVLVSSFDPIRRATAVRALQLLLKDGRIQPARIEEFVAKAREQIEVEIADAGDEAAQKVGIVGLPAEVGRILGSLKFRTSYGQNQLEHAVEVARIAGLLANEVGADPNTTKKGALLHDIGKAIDHEHEGSHVDAGVELAQRAGLGEAVVNCIAASHEGVDAKSVEAILVRTADAISAARPGARRESTDQYIKRMGDLENIADSFPGVEKSFAIQAGREVRVLVKPEMIDDLTAMKLAREVANKIEATLQHPGTVKVNVIRETRFSEVAR